MLYQTGGTIIAGPIALSSGWAINLGGGFHHACGYTASGFCPIADITLSIKHLQLKRSNLKAMIVDLDAHQGNGHERDFINDSSVFILDMFNPDIFPGDSYAEQAISRKVEVFPHTSHDQSYLGLLEQHLSESLELFHPDILYYNAGTDCMKGDPLGRLKLTPSGIIQRDQMVFQLAFESGVPVVMVLSGGYQPTTASVIAESILNLIAHFDLLHGNPTHELKAQNSNSSEIEDE